MKFKTYRLYRAAFKSSMPYKDGNHSEGFEREFKPTTIIFRARNEQEGMKKANKFWVDGNFGAGRIIIKESES